MTVQINKVVLYKKIYLDFKFPQAEEQLRQVERQRKELEEKQQLEAHSKRQLLQNQQVILNKNKARPKLSFSFGTKM